MSFSEKDLRQAEYFSNRVAKNRRLLSKWVKKEGIGAYRLYDRDIPEIPLALDLYSSESEKALVIALFERPYDKPEEDEVAWLDLMAQSARSCLEIPQNRVFVKTRKKMKGLAQYERAEGEDFTMEILESGLRFKVNLSGYLDTGLFLDHRRTRQYVKQASSGLRVLNLFSYTGSFSVYAASGGASHVSSVDLSNTYLAWSRENFNLNELSTENNSFIRSDALRFLDEAKNQGRTWDLVIADPPTFSNSTKTARDFDINRDWSFLVRACERVLAKDGTIVFSTNSRSLKWDESSVNLPSREISDFTLPLDFRNKRIHRCWLLGNYTSFSGVFSDKM